MDEDDNNIVFDMMRICRCRLTAGLPSCLPPCLPSVIIFFPSAEMPSRGDGSLHSGAYKKGHNRGSATQKIHRNDISVNQYPQHSVAWFETGRCVVAHIGRIL